MMPGFLETATFVSHSSTCVGPLQDCTKIETIGSIQLKVAAKPPNVNKKKSDKTCRGLRAKDATLPSATGHGGHHQIPSIVGSSWTSRSSAACRTWNDTPPDGPAVGFCPVSGSALIPERYLGTPTNERTLKRTNTMRFLISGLLLMELRLSIRGPTTVRDPSF
jgi:hypothetical protein